MTEYVGLNEFDIPACYRHRAASIADGHALRPICAVVVEFLPNGTPSVIVFGDTSNLAARENTALLLETIGVLSDAAAGMNAQASN